VIELSQEGEMADDSTGTGVLDELERAMRRAYRNRAGGLVLDGDAVSTLREEVVALRAARDRRALATAELLAVVRAVAAWEEGTGRADLLEALEEYGRALAPLEGR
jgi:hypothetical protein